MGHEFKVCSMFTFAVAALFPHNDVIKWKKHFPRYWLLCGEFAGHRWIPHTKASDTELWCFFDMRLNQQLSKQWSRCWFKMPSRSLWRYCNACNIVIDKNKNQLYQSWNYCALSPHDICIVAAILIQIFHCILRLQPFTYKLKFHSDVLSYAVIGSVCMV